MQQKIILGITGPMAAGKSTITEYIKEQYGGVSFRFSDMLRDILERIHVPPAREEMQLLSTFLRGTYGEDLMSKVLAKDVAASDEQLIIVEGIRRPSDVAYLTSMSGFSLLSVDVDVQTRYDRIVLRNENPDDQSKTFETFSKEQQQESETQIHDVMKQATHAIDNSGTREELFAQVDAIMKTLTQ